MRETTPNNILLTGASSGIGEGLARALTGRGDRVGLFARRADRLERLARELEEAGGIALALPGDVREPRTISGAVERITATWGRLDMVIVNAGSILRKPIHQQTGEEIRDTLEINLLGAVTTIHACLPTLLEQGSGQVVGITSLAGIRGLPWAGSYSASKAGLSNYLEALRIDLAPRGIAVTDIRPGFVETAMTEESPIPTPQILSLDRAVGHILRAIDRRRSSVSFPFPLSWVVRAGRLLPDWLYDRAVRRSMR